MTVDHDDAEIARSWLKRRREWHDDEVVTEYETDFGRWNGSRHAFAFMSGRTALRACVAALELQAGDEVILPGYTCVAVPDALRDAGLVPVYSDIELDTYGLDVRATERRIGPRTRAILLQHLYGLVSRDYDAAIALAAEHGLKIIEDCAHATGAEYDGRKVGTRGDVAFFSSEQSKVFSTVRGGMAVTDNDAVAQRLEQYRNSAGRPALDRIERQLKTQLFYYYRYKSDSRRLGKLAALRYRRSRLPSGDDLPQAFGAEGSRMTAPIAALGRNQLRKLASYNDERRATARRWSEWCRQTGYPEPKVIAGSTPVFLRFPVLVEPAMKRDRSWALRELGVSLGVWFVSHIHPRPDRVEGCPNADRAIACCVNFPSLLGSR